MKIIAGGALLLSIAALVVAIIRPSVPAHKPREHIVNKPILEAPSLPQNPFQLPTYPVPADTSGDPDA